MVADAVLLLKTVDLDISSSLTKIDFSQCPLIFWKNKCFNFFHDIKNHTNLEKGIFL